MLTEKSRVTALLVHEALLVLSLHHIAQASPVTAGIHAGLVCMILKLRAPVVPYGALACS
jgi:hypothetical protein